MVIDVPAEVEARLKRKADAAGVSVQDYLTRLIEDDDSREARLAAFREAMDERLSSLNAGEHGDGEEVMARLLGETRSDVKVPR